MGGGGDGASGSRGGSQLGRLASNLSGDFSVLKALWTGQKVGGDAARLSKYGSQAHAYDRFRSRFLWGRKPMLAACAARLHDRANLIWVDLGGGTAENVLLMAEYLPLAQFKKIYVVDLCPSLCAYARAKVAAHGWKNVEVVEADACTWSPPAEADLITFSYSLSMMPAFHTAVDAATEFLSAHGFIGVADFFVSAKYDLPLRQMGALKRWFWRTVFDGDGIDLAPERRLYLDHRFVRVCEYNGTGSLPYVPFLAAPYYWWVGRKADTGTVRSTADLLSKTEHPPLFPPTFIYSLSWEDPRPDEEVLRIGPDDTVLTLTSGSCNALDLALQGAAAVYAVDMNPAQSFLLELKAVAIRELPYEDTWKLFGEGVHPGAAALFPAKLAPFLSQGAQNFWGRKLYYFSDGFYYHGAMGKIIWAASYVFWALGLSTTVAAFCSADTMEEQRAVWESCYLVRFCRNAPRVLVWLLHAVAWLLFMNPLVLWFGAGVPAAQAALIKRDKLAIVDYMVRILDGLAHHTSMKHENYFFHAVLTGRFTRECCPRYLERAEYDRLQAGLVNNVHIRTNSFQDELCKRVYTKVILMDHVDWMDRDGAANLAACLSRQVAPGGRIIWRSASLDPPYAAQFRDAGFDVRCVARKDAQGRGCIDRVNMYASFWVGIRK